MKINKNFFYIDQYLNKINSHIKINFELDINLIYQNNKFLIIHNIFYFYNKKLLLNSNINKKELIIFCLKQFSKSSIIFPKYIK